MKQQLTPFQLWRNRIIVYGFMVCSLLVMLGGCGFWAWND